MPKILLKTTRSKHIYDIDFVTDEGKVNNRDFLEDEQIACHTTTPSSSDKERYLYSETKGSGKNAVTTFKTRMVPCVSAHCHKIDNLGDQGIVDGLSLVKHEPTDETNEMIQDTYFVIMGIYKEKDKDEDEADEEEV